MSLESFLILHECAEFDQIEIKTESNQTNKNQEWEENMLREQLPSAPRCESALARTMWSHIHPCGFAKIENFRNPNKGTRKTYMERWIRLILDSVSQQDLQCYVLCPLVIQLDKKVRIIETISYWAVTISTKIFYHRYKQVKLKNICTTKE